MTTSTYAIVHIPDNTPELSPDALGQHVTIRTHENTTVRHKLCHGCGNLLSVIESRGNLCNTCLDNPPHDAKPGYIASLILCPDCGTMHPPDDCDLVPCTGGCGEMVTDTIEGDPYCDDCALTLIPEDVRAMQAAPPALVRDIAALPDPAYATFWGRLLREYLADPPATNDIDALQDAVEHFAQDRNPFPSTPLSLAPTGPAAPPTRLAG